jgi:surface carbohydrate biosynthesis protein (TIGR04326 family)
MKILVLGDYEIDKTRVQIELLERSLELLSFKPTVVIKLHPACLVYDDGFKEFEVTDKTLDELFLEVDIAFTSAKTTSAVDAYCAGLTVISILDPLTLNLSPLRGVLGIQYVDTPQQLSAAINFSCENYYPSTKRDSYFTFGSNLLRWKTLLQL